MGTVHNVISEIISIIKTNVVDPNSKRKASGKSWVFDDIPLANLGETQFPRISVVSFGASSVPHELNSYQQRLNVRVEIQIRIRRNKWENQQPQDFLDDLTQEVIEALRLETSRVALYDNQQVFQSVLEAENTIYADDVLVKQLIYKNIMRR